MVRSQNSLIACHRLGSSSRTENAAAVAQRNPTTASPISRRVNRYVSHIGATMRAANFVHPASATNAPRAHGEVTNQNPQIRKAGSSASFVFELDAYCVNGYAAQANASVAPRLAPPKRKPASPRPRMQSRSNAITVACAAGRSSQRPLQPKKR